jgi:type VI secretion system protein ImpG
MSEELLGYYQRELAYLRRLGAEFARTHPAVAGRLRLTADEAEDPHVERMIEAFAFLTARVRSKLDDDFPELTDALMSVVYPHYQAPIPSMAIAKLVLDRGQSDATTGHLIERGAELEAPTPDGLAPCRFRTCYPVTLWPIEVESAQFGGQPLAAPATRFSAQSQAVLRIRLKCYDPEGAFEKFAPGMESLRFFIKGSAEQAYALYEMLFNSRTGVALASGPDSPQPVVLEEPALRFVGYELEEGMLPYPPRSLPGYRLLTEYFVFPQKYLFFDLAGLSPRSLAAGGNTLDIYIYFDQSRAELEGKVSADAFQLGCTPIVNLYSWPAEPIALSHEQTEYRVIPDARQPKAREVHTIERVTAVHPDDTKVEFRPFYSFKHAGAGRDAFWYASRRPSEVAGLNGSGATDTFLLLIDEGFRPSVPAGATLRAETVCFDRDRPLMLTPGSAMYLGRGGPLSKIECLGTPSAPQRPALKRGAMWRLISHLSLNHLSLSDEQDGADALREILKLYDFADSEQTRSRIEGLLGVTCRRIVSRVPDDPNAGFCRGLEVRVHLDEKRFVGSGAFLFACVLERFLGLYCSLNSFTRMIATTPQREKELCRWPPRAGNAQLV